MTTKELIRAEIERLKHYAEESKMEWFNEGYNQNAFAEDCRIRSFDKLLTFLDTLPDEPAIDCKDLEEAAKKYDEAESWRWEAPKYPRREAFEAGAKWQRNQLKTNSISAGYNQTDEEYDREMDFATSIIEKEHRKPTFSDAINYGIKLQKEQMMKEAIDIKVIESYNPACEPNERLHGISFIYDCKNDNQCLIAGDRAKIIIVKEEEE